MAEKYYLHRISHEGNASYSLMQKGYLTLGWSDFSDSGILGAARGKEGYPDFDEITEKYGARHSRSRWCMWYFARMKKGDTVVVPLYSGMFSVYKVCDEAKPIFELENIIPSVEGMWNKHKIVWKEKKLYDVDEERMIDLGFFIKVESIVENVPRDFVSGKFTSRLKIRTTSADISDIGELVEAGIKAGEEKKPITLYEDVIDPLAERMKSSFKTLNPDKFEQLVKWYLERSGASMAWIPAKNESGKRDGADADIIAEFDNLKYIVYVQAKWHEGETSEWAVHQIDSYKNQMSEGDPAYTYATWVISSADSFSSDAITEAEEKGVRLIDGKEFARMLLDVGLLDINKAFE
ncbi:Restriction endonuclease [Lachnospiraceae bacterium KHCPX20]|nr:Restriction endonuclease [Lachnospiraceae bacterium KHCPX20]